jgi:NADH:ubiquinone oxidoreductase subunit C
VSEVLAHRSRALTPAETEDLLRDRLGDGILRSVVEYGMFTLWIDPAAWVEAATRCRDERLLAYDMFDSLFGVDAREEGFDVVAVLYSTSTGNRIVLRARCDGGREAPTLASLHEVYRGANWMERETYDMFGIDFTGHPGLEPRILTVENFEGFPLRKDFHLAARVAKPWPGVAEPVELDEDGNVIEREVGLGDAPGPYELDKAMAAQAQQVNAPPVPVVDAAADTGAGDASAEVAASATSTGPTVASDAPAEQAPVDEDRAARAKAKAEERRRKQAEARAAKAKARAERAAGGDTPEAAAPSDTPADATDEPAPDAPADEPATSTPADDATDVAPDGAPAAGSAPETADADGAADADAAADESDAATSAPEDDRAARAKAKAEERRRKQAELRAARAKARAERADSGDDSEDGEDDA